MLETIITIILLYCVYMYLKNLNGCDCVNQQVASNLQKAEGVLIGFNFLGLLASILIMTNLIDVLKPYAKTVNYIIALYFAFVFVFNIYFAYNGVKFYNTLKADCKCAAGWEKYYLYYQIFMSVLIVLLSAWASIYGTYAYATGKTVNLEFSYFKSSPKNNKSKSKKKK